MRPTPDELAAGMRALLRAAGGELTSALAKAQVRRVMYVLKGARWNEAAFDLLHENELLRAALAEFGEAGEHAELPRSFAEANAQNLALRTALAGALDALRGGTLSDTGDARHALARKFVERP